MEWPFDDGSSRDTLIEFKDFTGTTIRESRLNRVRLVGVEMIDAEIDGYVENLVVNGVSVMPLVSAELDRQHPVRVLMRSDDPDDLRRAWAQLESTWDATIERARALPEEKRHEQVRGEWSITQTLRHLVFAIDAWLSRAIEDEPLPYHPSGLPPEFMDGIDEMGIDIDASPTFDEAVELWHQRSASVAEYLATANADDLQAACRPKQSPLWPPVAEGFAAIRAIRVVLDETSAHHRFAVRDLAFLESGPEAGPEAGPESSAAIDTDDR